MVADTFYRSTVPLNPLGHLNLQSSNPGVDTSLNSLGSIKAAKVLSTIASVPLLLLLCLFASSFIFLNILDSELALYFALSSAVDSRATSQAAGFSFYYSYYLNFFFKFFHYLQLRSFTTIDQLRFSTGRAFKSVPFDLIPLV